MDQRTGSAAGVVPERRRGELAGSPLCTGRPAHQVNGHRQSRRPHGVPRSRRAAVPGPVVVPCPARPSASARADRDRQRLLRTGSHLRHRRRSPAGRVGQRPASERTAVASAVDDRTVAPRGWPTSTPTTRSLANSAYTAAVDQASLWAPACQVLYPPVSAPTERSRRADDPGGGTILRSSPRPLEEAGGAGAGLPRARRTSGPAGLVAAPRRRLYARGPRLRDGGQAGRRRAARVHLLQRHESSSRRPVLASGALLARRGLQENVEPAPRPLRALRHQRGRGVSRPAASPSSTRLGGQAEIVADVPHAQLWHSLEELVDRHRRADGRSTTVNALDIVGAASHGSPVGQLRRLLGGRSTPLTEPSGLGAAR